MENLKKLFFASLIVGSSMTLFQSCLDDNNDNGLLSPTALVTVCPEESGSFVMNLDNRTVLIPNNVKTSPFGDKEVRALVSYTEDDNVAHDAEVREVYVNWIDSIRTKAPVVSTEDNAITYGNDPVEIVNDWVTVAEDGYLTLRIRTTWGLRNQPHVFNLVTGINPENPFEMELRHDAGEDLNGELGDALIAFNLNGLPGFNETVKIKLRWESFSGEKSTEFDLEMRKPKAIALSDDMRAINKRVF